MGRQQRHRPIPLCVGEILVARRGTVRVARDTGVSGTPAAAPTVGPSVASAVGSLYRLAPDKAPVGA